MRINGKNCGCIITDSDVFFPCNNHLALLPLEIQEGFNHHCRRINRKGSEI